ncbi:MAG: MarR family winged helix-turn-helix transcriptional regulator [Pseudomonadota bacterium]
MDKPILDPMTVAAAELCNDHQKSLPCTCLRLRRIARQITSVYDAALEPHGVSIVTYAVLSVLNAKSPLTLSCLAEMVGTDRTTLSRTVERMRMADLVAACTGDDRRERRLSLTAHGGETFRAARQSWLDTATLLEDRYGAERLSALHRLLADLEAVAQDNLCAAE